MKYLNRVKSRTPESVELEFILAGIGNRAHALLIDYLLWMLAILILLGSWGFLYSQITLLQAKPISDWFNAIQLLILFGVYIGYYVVFETLWRGQTPGKRYTNIRVIRDDGRNVGLQQSILRSLLRPVDDLLGLGFFFVMFSKQEKRLGDWVAGTISIQEGQAITDRQITLSPEAAELGQRMVAIGKIAALNPNEFATIRKYLYRYPGLSAAAKIQVSDRLAQQLLNRIELLERPPTTNSHLAIEAIYCAYQQQFRS
jgi:uncharacterized RDD family membrane protein YckC